MAKIRSRGPKMKRLERSRDSYESGRFARQQSRDYDADLSELEQLDTIRARLDEMSAQLDRVDEQPYPTRTRRTANKSSKALNAVARAMDRLDMDEYADEMEPVRPRMERAIDQLQEGDMASPLSRAARYVAGDDIEAQQTRQLVQTIKRDIAQLGDRLAAHEIQITGRLDNLDDIGELKDQIAYLAQSIKASRHDVIDRSHLADLAERVALVTEDNRASLSSDIAHLTSQLDRINRATLDSTTDQINQLSVHISALSEAHRDARREDINELGSRLDMMALTLTQLSEQQQSIENGAPQNQNIAELSSGFDAGIKGLFIKLDEIASDIEKHQSSDGLQRDVAAVAQRLDKLDDQLNQNQQTMRQLVAHQSEHRQSLDQSLASNHEAVQSANQKLHSEMAELVEKGIRGLYDRLDTLENEGVVDFEQSSSISDQIADLTRQLRTKTGILKPDQVIAELDKINRAVGKIKPSSGADGAHIGKTISAAIQPEFKALQDQLTAMKAEMGQGKDAQIGDMLDEQSQLVARRLQDTNERLGSLGRIERSLAGIESQMSQTDGAAGGIVGQTKQPIDAKARKAITIVHKSVEDVGSRLDRIEQNLAKGYSSSSESDEKPAALEKAPEAIQKPEIEENEYGLGAHPLQAPKFDAKLEAAEAKIEAPKPAIKLEKAPKQAPKKAQKPVLELDEAAPIQAAPELKSTPAPQEAPKQAESSQSQEAIKALEEKLGRTPSLPPQAEFAPNKAQDDDANPDIAARRATSFIAQARAAARENRSISNELGIPAVLRRNQEPETTEQKSKGKDTPAENQEGGKKSLFGMFKRKKEQPVEVADEAQTEEVISFKDRAKEATAPAQQAEAAPEMATEDKDWQPSPLDPTPEELAYHAPEMKEHDNQERDQYIDEDEPEGFFARNRTLIAASAFVVVMAGGAAGLLTTNLDQTPSTQLASIQSNSGIDAINTASIEPTGTGLTDLDQPLPTSDIASDTSVLDGTSPYASLAPNEARADRDVTNLIDPNQTQLAATDARIGPDLPVTYALPPAQIGPIKLREAAANGDARAQYEVASIYADGRNIEKDSNAAAIWYERAAILGFAPAQYRIGTFYESGIGVQKDLKAAKQWYERAADAGNRMAMHNLASLYAGGELGQQDFSQASQWFERAASRGVKDSQFNLGMLYARGLGVEQDLASSYKWFSLAARYGDQDARNMRQDIARALDVASLKRAQNDVATWAPKQSVIEANYAPAGTWDPNLSAGPKVSDQNVVARVQAVLTNLGYEIGIIDGLMGPQTANAIRSFEEATGMTQTGEVNPRLLAVFGTQPI